MCIYISVDLIEADKFNKLLILSCPVRWSEKIGKKWITLPLLLETTLRLLYISAEKNGRCLPISCSINSTAIC